MKDSAGLMLSTHTETLLTDQDLEDNVRNIFEEIGVNNR